MLFRVLPSSVANRGTAGVQQCPRRRVPAAVVGMLHQLGTTARATTSFSGSVGAQKHNTPPAAPMHTHALTALVNSPLLKARPLSSAAGRWRFPSHSVDRSGRPSRTVVASKSQPRFVCRAGPADDEPVDAGSGREAVAPQALSLADRLKAGVIGVVAGAVGSLPITRLDPTFLSAQWEWNQDMVRTSWAAAPHTHQQSAAP